MPLPTITARNRLMHRAAIPLVPGIALALNACVVAPPPGPSVMALPGQGKNFEAFQQDDVACRQYAWQQTGGASPGAAASQSAVGSAVAGTALGAATGAAIGSASGAAGAGAAIGAGAGLLAGSAIGANNAAAAYGGVQQLYDISYAQCMTAHGNSVQAAPTGYAAYPYPSYASPYPYYPSYSYPYPYAGYYGPAWYAPSIALGFGGLWGWGGGWGGPGPGGWRGGGGWGGPGFAGGRGFGGGPGFGRR